MEEKKEGEKVVTENPLPSGVKLASNYFEAIRMYPSGTEIKQYSSLTCALAEQRQALIGSLSIRTTTGALWIDADKEDSRYVWVRHITSEERAHDILPPASKISVDELISWVEKEKRMNRAKVLPFTEEHVAKAIRWRRPGFIDKKTGFTLCWDAWHGNFVALTRGRKLMKEWDIIPLYHWSEKELKLARDDDFIFRDKDGRDPLYEEYKKDEIFGPPWTFKDFLATRNHFDERFDMWLARRMREEGLVEKWTEKYNDVMKKVAEWAPSLNKEEVDLL